MRNRFVVTGLFVAVALMLVGSNAFAQATRTWVSGVGDDANPCSRTAPCKTFAGAISKTAAGGEIDALDPGGFGAVTITKSITIDGHGTLASILTAGTNGVIISAAATDVVTLRGLTIQGINNGGLIGVSLVTAGAVHIEDCNINNFAAGAVKFQPAAGATSTLYVKHSTLTENGGGGVLIGGAGTASAVIVKSTFFNDLIGLNASGTALVTIHESVFSGNSMYGVWSQGTAQVNMDHGLISANGVGVQGDSTVRLSEVMIGHNTTGLAGTNVASFGNNRVAAGNATNGTPSTTLPQQ